MSYQWTTMGKGVVDLDPRASLNLLYAIHAGSDAFRAVNARAAIPFGAKKTEVEEIRLLVEVTDSKELGQLKLELVEALKNFGSGFVVTFPGFEPVEKSEATPRFLTVNLKGVDVMKLAGKLQKDTSPLWNLFTAADLGMPVRAPEGDPLNIPVDFKPPEILVGVIDDGLPFADARFDAKLVALWDQGEAGRVTSAQLGNKTFGAKPAAFGYGAHMLRQGGSSTHVSLREWCEAFAVGGKNPDSAPTDEDALYFASNYRSMRRSYTHGAHVLDAAAGPIPIMERIERIEAPNATSINPPGWKPSTPAESVVGVQIPRGGVSDPSGRWLGAHVLDGLRYILSWAGKDTKVVVNVSYGPTTGPHDGTSEIERAVAQLVHERGNDDKGTKWLQVVLPSGNSYAIRGHGVAEVKKDKPGRFVWRVMPQGEVPVFMELWFGDLSEEEPESITVRIIAPGGRLSCDLKVGQVGRFDVVTNNSKGPAAQGDGGPPIASDDELRALAIFAPAGTKGNDQCKVNCRLILGVEATSDRDWKELPPAPPGDWIIEVSSESTQSVRVDAYISRSAPNMNARRQSTQSLFVDDHYDPDSYLRASLKDNESSYIKRAGSINGIACGDNVVVAGGYQLNTDPERHAPYSSDGPERPNKDLDSPWRAPTDESIHLTGVRAAGGRSGANFRLRGTSTAAPQLARAIATGKFPPNTADPEIRNGLKAQP